MKRFDVKIDEELWTLFRKEDVFSSDAEALENVLTMILSQIDKNNPNEMMNLLLTNHKVTVRMR